MPRVILSLCDFTGNWPAPYREAGYDVRQVDLEHGQDVRLLKLPDCPVHGILAAPPCTVFSKAGGWVPRTEEDWLQALSVVDACLRLVVACRPRWWCLENPAGSRVRHYIGPPAGSFQPWEFGDAYLKRTYLWGDFVMPGPLFTGQRPVVPTHGDRTTKLSSRHRAQRSATPPGFARAFFDANP
jgi:hypothetical protein